MKAFVHNTTKQKCYDINVFQEKYLLHFFVSCFSRHEAWKIDSTFLDIRVWLNV